MWLYLYQFQYKYRCLSVHFIFHFHSHFDLNNYTLCFITWSDNYRNIVSQPGRDRWLDLYILEVRDDIIKGLNKDFKMNITKQEDKALKELLYDDSIIIRPSDTTSGICVINRFY